ncbi:hypothetical protein DL98DRAFT_590234 [Cadophora sp. DSE1049]|nr:hypothetical protein DL98DRAFT_590234 [Cadophora sp. DSE1049]
MVHMAVFEEIGRQAAEAEKHPGKHYWELWLDGVDLGHDFKPDLRSRQKRQAFLKAERDMVYRVHKNKRTKARGEEKKKYSMSIEEAVFWAVVEPDHGDFTEEFIKATRTPFEKRNPREHEVINIYWRLGLSLDPVLNFENSEVTQRQLESRLFGVTWSGKNKPSKKEMPNRRRPKKPTNPTS